MGEKKTVVLQFQAPDKKGDYLLSLNVKNDSLIGIDVSFDIPVRGPSYLINVD